MNFSIHNVAVAAAPVVGVSISIAILHAAHVAFPPALTWAAWPQWAVLATVVHSCSAFCLFVADRVTAPAAAPPADA